MSRIWSSLTKRRRGEHNDVENPSLAGHSRPSRSVGQEGQHSAAVRDAPSVGTETTAATTSTAVERGSPASSKALEMTEMGKELNAEALRFTGIQTSSADHLKVESDLPRPVTSSNPVVKRARIEGPGGLGVKVHWGKFIRRINIAGTGSQPSESLHEFESTDVSAAGSRHGQSLSRMQSKNIDNNNADYDENGEPLEVEHIVVDNPLLHSGQAGSITSELVTNPEMGTVGLKSQHGDGEDGEAGVAATPTGTQVTDGHDETFWERFWVLWRIWHATRSFYDPRFCDPVMEDHYLKEMWYQTKPLYLWGAAFIILNWAVYIASLPRPFPIEDKVFYYGISTSTTIILPFMILYNYPRRRYVANAKAGKHAETKWWWSTSSLYQFTLEIQTWQWIWYQVIFMYLCGFYTGGKAHTIVSCQGKGFLSIFYNAVGLPAISIFALGMSRFMYTVGTLITLGLISALLLPDKHTVYRLILNFITFHVFILYIHYKKEAGERRLYSLRDQLKVQFKATQKAQVSERKAADSKKRLTSYIFHEVRVPLNTALLAVQNMQATGQFEKDSEKEVEYAALEGSLNMMSKVLNDVLDFNRLDAGKFESVSKPYNLHTFLRSMLAPLKLAANSRELTLETDLDPSINEITARSYFCAKGYSPEDVEILMAKDKNEHAMVLGDEVRLRQILTNLTSNATKFTPAGGKIKFVTKLLYPSVPPKKQLDEEKEQPSEESAENTAVLSRGRVFAHNLKDALFENIVVRFEVHDTGVGIKSKELIDKKLFSPYVQTEIGRFQGGKGTGLGLALVRRIVKLSGGRLGVKSKLGAGSMFWLELNLGVGRRVLAEQARSQGSPHPHPLRRTSLTPDDHKFDTSTSLGTLPPPPTPSDIVDVNSIATPTPMPNSASVPLTFDKPLRCLVVDDDSLTRKLMTRMLTRLGCMVDTAINGQVAIEMIVAPKEQENSDPDNPMPDNQFEPKYHIIFLDNQMPVMSGLEVCEQLRDAGRSDFVVGVTGNAMLSDQEEYMEAGANHVLTKPVLERSLKSMLILADKHRKGFPDS